MKPPIQPSVASRHSRPPMERMLRIHQAVQAGYYPNASTLAESLEVSSKTTQRDLDFMRDRMGLPLAYDSQRFGYHYTEDVNAFPTLQITEGELFALLVAEKALQQYRGTTFEKPLVSAFQKMAAALPDTVSLNLADWNQTISFRTSAEPLLNLEVFDLLARATARRQQLRLIYRKPGRSEGEARVVDPYHLANINGEWFLFAYCHLRHAIRTFAPARMTAVQPTGKTFERPKKFSLDNRLKDSFSVLSGEGQHAVVIRFSARAADYILEKKWHPSQQLRKLKSGGLELRLTLSSLAEIQRWILGWGGEAAPVKPPELVRAVKQAARRTLAALRGTGVLRPRTAKR